MNKIYLIALISIVLGVASCSKEDPEIETFYTVTFQTDGGTPTPKPQQVKAGEKAVAPTTNPAKSGYVFMFWHLSDKTTAYVFQTPVAGDITLQAEWEEEAKVEYVQITWEKNGGSWPTGDNHATEVVKGGALAEPLAPVKAGYMFDGWYKEIALTSKIDFPYIVSNATGTITLYAKWKTEGENPSSNNHTIKNAAEWTAAVAAVNAAGSNKTHTFTITQSFSLPGVGTNTLFAKELTGLTVNIKGQGTPAPEISIATGSKGYLIYLSVISQKITLENIVLRGHSSNNAAVLGVKSGEMVIGNGTLVTGNTNMAGGSGGVDVGSKLILNGGDIIGNVSGTLSANNGHGGGVFVDYMAEFIMENGRIGSNMVYGQGGGVHIDLFGRFTMKGGEIYSNTAWAISSGARGGGVYNKGGDFYMSGGKITGYSWVHGNEADLPEHFTSDLLKRDNCNSVVIGATVMGIYGAALYSSSGTNYYGTFSGDTFTKTGDIGYNIHIERDIEILNGVRLNYFAVNGETYQLSLGEMSFWGNFYNTATENIALTMSTTYKQSITLDMLVPSGNNKILPGTYTFGAIAGASATAYTFVDNNYTSYVQDANNKKLKMTGGTVKISVTGTGDNAVYTVVMDCTLENGSSAKGTYRGKFTWKDATKT